MFMLLGLLSYAVACDSACMGHLQAAKTQIFAQSFAQYDDHGPGNGEIDWDEFYDDIKAAGSNGVGAGGSTRLFTWDPYAGGSNYAVTVHVESFLTAIDGDRNGLIDPGEFQRIGDALLASQDPTVQQQSDLTVKWGETGKGPGDSTSAAPTRADVDWMVALSPSFSSGDPRGFADADAADGDQDGDGIEGNDEVVVKEQMVMEVSRMLFAMIGEFDRAAPEGKFGLTGKYAGKTYLDMGNVTMASTLGRLEPGFWKATKHFDATPLSGTFLHGHGWGYKLDGPELSISNAEFEAARALGAGDGASFLETADVTKNADKPGFREATKRPVRATPAAPRKRHFGIETDGQIAHVATDGMPHRAAAAAGTTATAPQGAFAELNHAAAQAAQHEDHAEHAEAADHK